MEGPLASPPSRRPLSLYFFIAWALILAFNSGVLLWDITGALAQFGRPSTAFGWLSLVATFVAPFGFGICVYGLWGLRSWGRYLFLGLSALYFGVNLVGVWLPPDLPLTPQALMGLRNTRLLALFRHGLAIAIPFVYFNLSQIKALFDGSANRRASESIGPV